MPPNGTLITSCCLPCHFHPQLGHSLTCIGGRTQSSELIRSCPHLGHISITVMPSSRYICGVCIILWDVSNANSSATALSNASLEFQYLILVFRLISASFTYINHQCFYTTTTKTLFYQPCLSMFPQISHCQYLSAHDVSDIPNEAAAIIIRARPVPSYIDLHPT